MLSGKENITSHGSHGFARIRGKFNSYALAREKSKLSQLKTEIFGLDSLDFCPQGKEILPTTKHKKLMKQLTDIQKERLRKAIKYLVVSIATAIAMALGLTSCNVTRTITTESRSLTRGDTAVIIQSKTIESYNAKKN